MRKLNTFRKFSVVVSIPFVMAACNDEKKQVTPITSEIVKNDDSKNGVNPEPIEQEAVEPVLLDQLQGDWELLPQDGEEVAVGIRFDAEAKVYFFEARQENPVVAWIGNAISVENDSRMIVDHRPTDKIFADCDDQIAAMSEDPALERDPSCPIWEGYFDDSRQFWLNDEGQLVADGFNAVDGTEAEALVFERVVIAEEDADVDADDSGDGEFTGDEDAEEGTSDDETAE